MISKLIKLVLGVVFVAFGVWAIVVWWGDVLLLVRGGVGFMLILVGLVCFAVLD